LRSYETVIIWAPSLSESEQEAENGKIAEAIKGSGSEFKGIDVWGRRQLAYPIKKQTEGIYCFFRWDGESTTTEALDKMLRIKENCLRHVTLKTGEEGPTATFAEEEDEE
jgi:small subunit ribosomal protein S6